MAEHEEPDYGHRNTVTLAAVVAVLVLAIVLVVAMNLLDNQRRTQRCVDSGRRDCFSIPTPPVAQGTPR